MNHTFVYLASKIEPVLNIEACAAVRASRRYFVPRLCRCFGRWSRTLPFDAGRVSAKTLRSKSATPILALTVDLSADLESRQLRQLRLLFAADMAVYCVASFCSGRQINGDSVDELGELCRAVSSRLHCRIRAISR